MFYDNFIFIIFILIFILNKIIFMNNLGIFISNRIEIKKIDNYFKYCIKFEQNKIKHYKKIINPLISIISPIYNRKSYILRLLKNIQYQSFQNFEIILVDDCSIDNSLDLINNYYRNDRRITIIKNKKRKGTFLARNIGVLYSKGKYVIIPDPDDILIKNIIIICYKYAEKFKYDIIRFNIFKGKEINNKAFKEYGNKNLTQPEIYTNIFYLNNELIQTDYFVWNKFIRKEIYIISLNSLTKFYLNLYMTIFEDQIMNYILLKNAKSLYFLNHIGYYYFLNSMSICNQPLKKIKNKILFKFIYFKFIFEYSKNTKYEKDIGNYLITEFFLNLYKLTFDNNNYNFFYNIINMYLTSKFLSNSNKNILINIKKYLLK